MSPISQGRLSQTPLSTAGKLLKHVWPLVSDLIGAMNLRQVRDLVDQVWPDLQERMEIAPGGERGFPRRQVAQLVIFYLIRKGFVIDDDWMRLLAACRAFVNEYDCDPEDPVEQELYAATEDLGYVEVDRRS